MKFKEWLIKMFTHNNEHLSHHLLSLSLPLPLHCLDTPQSLPSVCHSLPEGQRQRLLLEFTSQGSSHHCCECLYIYTYLVMCEVSHQPHLDVGVVGDTTQYLGALESSLRVGAAVIQIPGGDKKCSSLNYAHFQPIHPSESRITPTQ